jgi:ABC-2 type transport system ATP-binding protein
VVDAEPVVESAPVAEPAAPVEPAPEPVSEPAPEATAPIAPAPAPADRDSEPQRGTLLVAAPQPPSVPPVVEAAPAAAGTAAAASVIPGTPAVPATGGDALVLRGVTKRFGSTHAVDGIDLTVPAGTFYGLVGPNGAGKTTTLSMIAGLLEPDRGTIHIGGVDAAAKPLAAKRLMGVLPDRLRTFDRLTGRQLLYYYGVLRKLPPAVVESRTADLARAFDLEDALGRSVSDYSAGMLKKVMLAGALIHSPRLLVLDEPFEAVDPVSSSIILDILSAYVAHGGTVILSSHGMELVERVCTRVAVIVAGQVLAEGTVAEVRGELTLEQRFVELAGGLSDVEGLEWLHTFSD